jgi:hypothetical protein
MAKKHDEYGASGLGFQKWFPFSYNREGLSEPDGLQLRKWEFWESLRRNEKYKKLCEGIEFLPTGTVSPRWLIPLENRSLIAERQGRVFELFGVESIMDPSCSYKKLFGGVIEILGVTPDAVTLIAPHIKPGQTFPDADSYKKRFIEDGRFIALRIDLTQPNGEIRQKAEHFISEQRTLAGIAPPNTRTRDQLMEAFQVYDRIEDDEKTPTDIIKELWPKEYEANRASNDELEKKYSALQKKYRKAGFEDWDEKAHDETYGTVHDSGVRFLYQRVTDRYLSAKNRIEGMTQK